MKEHTPAETAVLAALSRRGFDTLREFQSSPSDQWDGLDNLIAELSDLVDDLKRLRKGRKENGPAHSVEG